MTTQFDNYFHNLIENMTVNDVANVGTGWFDSKGSVPKVLGCMQKRNGSCSKKRKKNKR